MFTRTSNPSVMQHSFSEVPNVRTPRSQFKRNYRNPTTFNADYLIPIYCEEIYPGDTVRMSWRHIIRLLTPLVPFMDNLYVDYFAFYAPHRLLQDNWEKLMGAQDNPGDSIDYATPKMISPAGTGYTTPADWSDPSEAELAGALQDYIGIPPGVESLEYHNYYGRMYNLVYNEWFRDQNLQNSVVVDTDDGPDTYTDYKLLKRGKRHDYFTSALPWLQKGTAADIPLGQSAEIKYDSSIVGTDYEGKWVVAMNTGLRYGDDADVNTGDVAGDTRANMYADLTGSAAATIGSLFESYAIQQLLMADARGGTRYVELINSHFGVTSPDFRLQRPEYLGGKSVPFMVSPIAQTSETGTTELGTLGATATSIEDGFDFVQSFVEHGRIMVLVNVRADLTYQQGLHRDFSRDTRYDFYFPAFANLPEQPVYLKEIYAQGPNVDTDADGTPDDDEVFGYQERWAELKYGQSRLSGRMRSSDANSIDYYHLAEEFSTPPALDENFIVGNTPIERVSTVTTEPHFIADFFAYSNWVRPIPMYSIPGLVNRF